MLFLKVLIIFIVHSFTQYFQTNPQSSCFLQMGYKGNKYSESEPRKYRSHHAFTNKMLSSVYPSIKNKITSEQRLQIGQI